MPSAWRPLPAWTHSKKSLPAPPAQAAKVENAGKQKVAGTGKEVPRHRQHQEVAGSRSIALRPEQQDPEDRREQKVDEGAIRRDPSRLNIALQRYRAHGHAMGSAQPRRYPVAQPFVQNIPQDASKR